MSAASNFASSVENSALSDLDVRRVVGAPDSGPVILGRLKLRNRANAVARGPFRS